MKKLIGLILALCMLCTLSTVLAEEWTCEACAKAGLDGNFCSNCGAAKPAKADNVNVSFQEGELNGDWLTDYYVRSAGMKKDTPYLTNIMRYRDGREETSALAVALYDLEADAMAILAGENIVSAGCEYYWQCGARERYEVELVSPESIAGLVFFVLSDPDEEADISIDIPNGVYANVGEELTIHYYVFDEARQMLLAQSGTMPATECENKGDYQTFPFSHNDDVIQYAFGISPLWSDGIMGVFVNEAGEVCGIHTAEVGIVSPMTPEEAPGVAVTADLRRLDDGSYETGDGRFQVKVGQAMVYRDGDAYTTDAALLRNADQNREEIQIYNFYRNDSILLTVPYNSVLTGDVFGLRQIGCNKDSHYDDNMGSMKDFLGWTFSNQILGVCHDGDYMLCYRDGGNDFIDAAVRVLYWDTDRQEAVFYIYAAFDTAPYEYEAVAAVRMEDAQVQPSPTSPTGRERKDCWTCGGDGYCNKCGGRGRVRQWVGDQYMDVTCASAFCSGGKCSSCGGKGYQ